MKTLQSIVDKVAGLMDCTSGGSCGVFAMWVTKIAMAHGMDNFQIVFGHVQCHCCGYWTAEHIWIEHDGRKIDPTLKQFPYFIGYRGGKRRKYTPQEFIKKSSFSLKNTRHDGVNAVKFHLKGK